MHTLLKLRKKQKNYWINKDTYKESHVIPIILLERSACPRSKQNKCAINTIGFYSCTV